MRAIFKYSSIFTITIVTLFLLLGGANPPSDTPRTIEVTGSDNLQFSVSEIEASPGDTLRIVLTTESSLPPSAMSHNFVVVEPDIEMMSFINASSQASDQGYIATDFKDQIIASTDMVGDSETSQTTFVVPDKPGEYPYVCTFPGHYAGGMRGTLTVRESDA